MYTDVTSYLNSTYSTYDVSTDSDDTTSSSDLDQDDFLTLLLAQMENQDPLNPLEDTEMLSELAQFSSLEQLTALNETMSDVVDSLSYMTVNSAVSYLGMDVTAEGNTIHKGESSCTSVTYELEEDVESITAHVYDSDGDIVASVELSGLSAGEHEFVWDGEAYTGEEAPEGTYYVAFEAYDENGEYQDVTSEVAGTVTGLTGENGYTQFYLDDGRLVDMTSITSVQTPAESESES